MYVDVHDMLIKFATGAGGPGGITYHTYPAPNYDSEGGGIYNSYVWGWDDWLRGQVDSEPVRLCW